MTDSDGRPPSAPPLIAVVAVSPPPPRWPTRHIVTVMAFLAFFLLLIFAFRSVLFPFLMAIFLAYLVEPVVGWVSKGKRLGMRWGRGPTLILMYAVVLVGVFYLVSCGVQKGVGTIQRTIAQLKTELDTTSAAAEISLARPAPSKVTIPAGTALSLVLPGAAERRFKTAFAAQIDEGLTTTRVLLDPVDAAPRPPPEPTGPGRGLEPTRRADDLVGTELSFVDVEALALPKPREAGADVELTARVGETARGVEVVLDRRVVGPLLVQIERLTGMSPDPSQMRLFLREYSREHGADFGNWLATWGRQAVFRVFGSAYELILILMLTAFIVIDRRKISEFFATLPPPHARTRYEGLMAYVDRGLAGVIRGQLLICVVNGLLTWVGLQVYGIPYAMPLALLAAVFSLIPVFGTIASSIPIVLVAFSTLGVGAGVFALAWIGFIHLLEANLFNPLIMGSNAEMHPVLIIFALLAGEHAFGIWGALLAVPTASIIQSCFKYHRHEVLGIPREATHAHGAFLRGLLSRRRARGAEPHDGGSA